MNLLRYSCLDGTIALSIVQKYTLLQLHGRRYLPGI